MAEHLLLKWGTVKGWDDMSEKSQEILQRYFADGVSLRFRSAARQPRQPEKHPYRAADADGAINKGQGGLDDHRQS
jgi:hypothetical protein